MHQLHSREVNETHLGITAIFFSDLKRSIFNKVDNFTSVCLTLLRYFTFFCVQLTQYVLRHIAETFHVFSVESKSLAAETQHILSWSTLNKNL